MTTQKYPAATDQDWRRTVAMQPLATGEQKIVDLGAYYAGVERLGKVQVFGPQPDWEGVLVEPVASSVDGKHTALRLEGQGECSGRVLIRAQLMGNRGAPRWIELVVDYRATPLVEFSFADPSRTVQTVFVAGSFNGWNATINPLAGPAADGSFRAQFPVPPGHHVYKLVVDGNWTPDPACALKESDGFNGFNSVLEVEGQAAGAPLMLWPVPRAAGESDDDRTVFLVKDEAGASTAPLGIVVMMGNRRVGAAGPSPWEGAQAPAGLVTVTQQGNRIELKGLKSLDEPGVDGVVRVMACEPVSGRWGQAALYRTPGRLMQPDWRGRALYFAMTDRFCDGNPANSTPIDDERLIPAANYHGGDWAGLRAKIREGYFDRLGVGAIWISAINAQPDWAEKESVPPGHYFSAYHGYWPLEPDRVNPRFGSMQELQDLVREAHEHDILVLLDLVTNHVHRDHPWHRQHPEWFGSLYLPDGTRNIRKFDVHPFTTWFDDFLPSFDYLAHPEATEAMTSNAVWWTEQTGIDGFRQDAVKHVQPVFWKMMTRRLRDQIELPQGRRLFQVGETISSRQTIMEFVSGETLDGQFDFPLYWPLRDALGVQCGDMSALARAIEDSCAQYPPEALMSPLIGNHDVSRLMAFADGSLRLGLDEKSIGWKGTVSVKKPIAYQRLMMAQALLMSLPGVPMMYYGDEIGLTGAGDPDNRRPMRFEAQLKEEERKVLENMQALGTLRRASSALKWGTYQTLADGPDFLAFARVCTARPGLPDQAMIVVMNRSKRNLNFDVPMPGNLDHARMARLVFEQGRQVQSAPVVCRKGLNGRLHPWSVQIYEIEF